eukprot:2861336-Prymnesium_polylepis.2
MGTCSVEHVLIAARRPRGSDGRQSLCPRVREWRARQGSGGGRAGRRPREREESGAPPRPLTRGGRRSAAQPFASRRAGAPPSPPACPARVPGAPCSSKRALTSIRVA